MSQVAVKIWSVLARHLREGGSIVTLHKSWEMKNDAFAILPTYAGQDLEAIKPDVWMSLRQELKAPLEGHAYIRAYAEVVEALEIRSTSALGAIEGGHGLTRREAERLYQADEPGLVALVLRVYRLPRSYKFANAAENEGEGELVSLPFDVAVENLDPVLEDAAFELRHERLRAALPTVSDAA